jgi:hypothetical protein
MFVSTYKPLLGKKTPPPPPPFVISDMRFELDASYFALYNKFEME